MTDEREAVFTPDGSRWVPSTIAAGPWDAGALHGGPPTALVGRLMLDHDPHDTDWFLARLTVELIRPVPMAPLAVRVELSRPGRRVQLLDAVITAPDGTEVLWARGLRLAQSPNGIDESQVPLPAPPDLPSPTSQPRWRFESRIRWQAFGDAFEFRVVRGAPFEELGPASVWARLDRPLLAGEAIHPLDRVLTLADFPNGFGNAVPFDVYAYINPDLTVSLSRLPEGEWVLLDAHMYPRSTGHGTAGGTLADQRGVIGTAVQSLLISAR